eukprot:3452180-Prymnesium_polylepis.2
MLPAEKPSAPNTRPLDWDSIREERHQPTPPPPPPQTRAGGSHAACRVGSSRRPRERCGAAPPYLNRPFVAHGQ